mgnify:CR=1 FL=1
MATFRVTNELSEIKFAPGNETLEIIQNVKTIISTIKGSCPLYREFGISADNLDLPQNLAKTKIAAELSTQIAEYEPRCKLKSVEFASTLDGEFKIAALIEV